jgi:hypothetical protein
VYADTKSVSDTHFESGRGRGHPYPLVNTDGGDQRTPSGGSELVRKD